MEVISTTLKPTIEEVFNNEFLQTNPLPYNGPVLMRVDAKDFDDKEMTIQELTKKDKDDHFKALDISNLRSYLKKDKEKMRKRKRNKYGSEQRGPSPRSLPKDLRRRELESR
jgi:hypothetical protein